MKKLICYIFLTIFSILTMFTSSLTTLAENYFFAKVVQEDVYLYSDPIDNIDKTMFEIPKTYFVKLLDETNNDFYYAMYKDVYGYVKKSQVVVMDGTPTSPYPNATFRIFSPDGIGLYSSPSTSLTNQLTNIPYLTNTLKFYGYISGQEAIPEKSNIWYYCNYYNELNYYGYVYSVFCDQLSQIQDNLETFNVIENPIFKTNESPTELSPTAMAFIIIGVSIPCLLVIYLLIRPSLTKDKILNEHPKAKKKYHGDYFEFDDNELN